jgi:hypothetical protein
VTVFSSRDKRPLSADELRVREINLRRMRPFYEEQTLEDFQREQKRRREMREMIDRSLAAIRRQLAELESSER